MQNNHGIVSSIKYAMVSCLLDESEKKVIEERIEGWHNIRMTISCFRHNCANEKILWCSFMFENGNRKGRCRGKTEIGNLQNTRG